jgi:hypothetical protein
VTDRPPAPATARVVEDTERRALLGAGALVLAAAAVCSPTALAQPVEVLTLRFRTAEDLLPLLQPLVAPGGGLSGEADRLFLRTTPANAREIRQLVAELDRPPRRLRLTLRQDPPPAASAGPAPDRGVRLDSAAAAAGRQREASRPHGARIAGSTSAESVLEVTEGAVAYLTMPTSVAFVFNLWQPQRDGGWIEAPGLAFYDAIAGFNVRASVRGDLVTLDLEPDAAAQPMAAGGRVAHRVRSRLGQWFAVGDAESRAATLQTAARSGADAQAPQRGLWIRVEDLGPAAGR